MDRFGGPAGDTAYDSDADADDEFERSGLGLSSLPMPGHFDYARSDGRSDSEDGASVDEGDTPTTQAWTDREGRSPLGNIKLWTEEQVAEFMASISPSLKQYAPAFSENAINGDALAELHHDELRELGVNSVGHRLTLLKAVYEQKVQAGITIEEHHYVPPSAEGDAGDLNATQDDISRVIESIRLRDSRIIAAEAELRGMRHSLERIVEENRKLREETLPMMRLVKDRSTPLPDPSAGPLPSPRDANEKENKGSGLGRKLSAKKLWLGAAPKQQPSPTHPASQAREVREDAAPYLEASAAAMAASTHLTASMTSQPSPNGVFAQQHSPTSPAYSAHMGPSSAGLGAVQHHQTHHGPTPSSAVPRSFPRESSSRADTSRPHTRSAEDNATAHHSYNSHASTLLDDGASLRTSDPRRRQVAMPSPRDDDSSSTRHRERERDNPQVEIFKSFRVSTEDPCRVVLPVALKRYNISDDWHQYALYIVHGDQERCLGLEEKPLMLFKQLDREGRKPMFMLRRHAAPAEGWSGYHNSGASGNTGADGGGGSAGKLPGGVL